MLGLRRFKNVQIDIWQGDIFKFAADGVVCFTEGSGDQIIIEENTSLESAAAIVKVPVNRPFNAPPVDPSEQLRLLFKELFETVDKLGLRHLLIPGDALPPHKSMDPELTMKIGFSTLHCFLELGTSKNLGRVTFVADDSKVYDILQQNLFAEFTDELDEDGF